MHRTISDYKITKRKDGRYYVRIQEVLPQEIVTCAKS